METLTQSALLVSAALNIFLACLILSNIKTINKISMDYFLECKKVLALRRGCIRSYYRGCISGAKRFHDELQKNILAAKEESQND